MKPIIKWCGGKTQLLKEIDKLLPVSYNKYYEPFLGGGALLFHLKPEVAIVNDNNRELMNIYKCFTNSELFNKLKLKLDDLEVGYKYSDDKKKFYYSISILAPYSANVVRDAARTIFLNKTCFNGLYRVNKIGKFNVPFGNKSEIKLYDEVNFNEIFEYININVIKFCCGDYTESLIGARQNDFVYFDPPYYNSSKMYGSNDFNETEQIRLKCVVDGLTSIGVKCMITNSDYPFIRELYKDYNIHVVKANRSINCKKEKRKKCVNELIITNY